jgi:hypothetical protein
MDHVVGTDAAAAAVTHDNDDDDDDANWRRELQRILVESALVPDAALQFECNVVHFTTL